MKKIDYKLELTRAICLLSELVSQTDEDTPHECRSRHLEDSMRDAHVFVSKHIKLIK